MDERKMAPARPQFPIVDALLLTPEEALNGHIGICTNTSAPGQVYNDVLEENRASVSVLGPLIVSRDGTERMILNSLAHPTLTHLILFSEESLTFSPSTNLLLALMNGFDHSRDGNYIKGGQAASAHFPNLSRALLDAFREHITVLPLFMSQNKKSAEIVAVYLSWLAPRVSVEVLAYLTEANAKDKKYFDHLNKLVALLRVRPTKRKAFVALDPKDFQHLQPPKVEVPSDDTPQPVPFCVSLEDGQLRLDIDVGGTRYVVKGDDDFRTEYSLMKALGEKKRGLSPLTQFLIGAELNRLNIERMVGVKAPPFIVASSARGTEKVPLEPIVSLVPDKQYYYKIGLKDGELSVMCMAFDICEEVFDLRSKSTIGLFKWLAKQNRFQEYEMDILHRMDIGGQIGRAAIAQRFGYSFIQDFSSIFKINTETLPLVIAESDTFLDTHRKLLLKTYTEGLTEEHGDVRKGLARTVVALAIFRNTSHALEHMPAIYKQADVSVDEMRSAYKQQLLRFDHDGDYSYGERTRVHFGFDQLVETPGILKKDSSRATIIQRFDPTEDMSWVSDSDTGRPVYTHDPCLTHDIFFVVRGTLHSFHIARAHNLPNAYPENILGLYDAYVSTVRDSLGLAGGDMYMLSSRGNILLLTEEQRVRKIIAEPSKPMGETGHLSGPYLLGESVRPSVRGGVSYTLVPLYEEALFSHPILERLQDFEGINILERAIDYLVKKGGSHNNPVLSTHQAGRSDPQGDHLVFFQANVFGKKLHATVVFANHVVDGERDLKLVSAVASAYAKKLGVPLGDASIFYVNAT